MHKELKGVKSQQFEGGLNKRYPMLYSEVEMSEDVRLALQKEEEAKMRLYPPASANKMEFHILKFYCFSSALVYGVLKVGGWSLCAHLLLTAFGFERNFVKCMVDNFTGKMVFFCTASHLGGGGGG